MPQTEQGVSLRISRAASPIFSACNTALVWHVPFPERLNQHNQQCSNKSKSQHFYIIQAITCRSFFIYPYYTVIYCFSSIMKLEVRI